MPTYNVLLDRKGTADRRAEIALERVQNANENDNLSLNKCSRGYAIDFLNYRLSRIDELQRLSSSMTSSKNVFS